MPLFLLQKGNSWGNTSMGSIWDIWGGLQEVDMIK